MIPAADARPRGRGEALSLRQLGRPSARLQTALSVLAEPWLADAGGAAVAASLDAPRRAAADVPWLAGTIDGAAFAVQLPWGVARRLAGVPVEGCDAGEAALLVEAGLAPWLDAAEAASGLTLRFEALEATRPSGLAVDTTVALQGKDTTGGFVQMRQAVALSDGAAEALAGAQARRRRRRRDCAGLVLRVALDRSALAVTTAALDALRVGDAIVLDDAQGDGLAVIEGHLALAARIDADGVARIAPGARPAPIGEGVARMAEDEPDAVQREAALDEVELRLSFRAGEARMSLGALREMGPGAVIETTDPANAAVEIVVNGRVVGTGELIDVDGMRAVQVRTLFAGR